MKKVLLVLVAVAAGLGSMSSAFADAHHRECHRVYDHHHHHWVRHCR
ncbi:hypothetical protein [Paraburkholderia rhizosphaerae]|nr:hypothetical protein [Paraburkholderia rhizosphaerae]